MDLKHLLKRGALLAAANWQTVAIQFVAETTFQVLLAVPIVGAAMLVAVLLGGDLTELLQGSLRDIFTTIASTLMSEPFALVAFVTSFAVVLLGGSVLMFAVKGGTVDVLVAANADAGPIEQHPLTIEMLRHASRFTLTRFTDGCARLFRPYLDARPGADDRLRDVGRRLSRVRRLRLPRGRRARADHRLDVRGGDLGGAAGGMDDARQHAVPAAADRDGGRRRSAWPTAAARRRGSSASEFRELAGVFLVVVVLVIAATLASALAWSGVGLIAFVPLVGLAVFPLQLAALLVRGLAFEYLGLTALGAYLTLYQGYASRRGEFVSGARTDHGRGGGVVGVTGAI